MAKPAAARAAPAPGLIKMGASALYDFGLYRQIQLFCLYMRNQDISPTLRTLFADLVQQIENAPAAGSPYRREREGIRYHYAKIPVGARNA